MGGGSDQTSTTQSQSVTQLPPWVNQAAQQNYAFAQNAAMQPLQQFQGQTVANVGPQMQQGWNLAATSGGSAGADQYNASQAAYLAGLGQTPEQVTPQRLASTNLQPYMNPYTSSVINATLPIMKQNLGLQQAGNEANATNAGAFGGSRLGVQQGVTQAQGAMDMGQMAAQLNQANYGQAQAGAQFDIGQNLAAQQLNQQAQQNQLGYNLTAAGGLANLGQQAQRNQAANFTELMTAGSAEQQQAQNQINANLAKFQQAWQYPYQQLGVVQSALGMTPYGQAQQGTSQTQTQAAANPLGEALGGLQALGGLFGGGGMFGAGGLFGSDRSMKTDIAKVGMHPAGVPLYSYRYKGDPKTYPKVVGPMAEDVAKVAPHAVAPIPGSGGRMAVNMGALGALTPPPMTRVPRAARLPQPSMAAGPMAGPMAGALAAPGVAGGVGALGSMTSPVPRIRPPRPPQIRGALGG